MVNYPLSVQTAMDRPVADTPPKISASSSENTVLREGKERARLATELRNVLEATATALGAAAAFTAAAAAVHALSVQLRATPSLPTPLSAGPFVHAAVGMKHGTIRDEMAPTSGQREREALELVPVGDRVDARVRAMVESNTGEGIATVVAGTGKPGVPAKEDAVVEGPQSVEAVAERPPRIALQEPSGGGDPTNGMGRAAELVLEDFKQHQTSTWICSEQVGKVGQGSAAWGGQGTAAGGGQGGADATKLVLHGFEQVLRCDDTLLRRARELFLRRGWPGPNDRKARMSITELLGLSGRLKMTRRRKKWRRPGGKRATYLGWAMAPGAGPDGEQLAAAAILSVYRYRGRRRCACLEFVVSQVRGAGSMLLRFARRFLQVQQITRLYSGVDLSRPLALSAHLQWGFRTVEKENWAQAGLAFYSGGDVLYMMLDLAHAPEGYVGRDAAAGQLMDWDAAVIAATLAMQQDKAGEAAPHASNAP